MVHIQHSLDRTINCISSLAACIALKSSLQDEGFQISYSSVSSSPVSEVHVFLPSASGRQLQGIATSLTNNSEKEVFMPVISFLLVCFCFLDDLWLLRSGEVGVRIITSHSTSHGMAELQNTHTDAQTETER